MFTLAGRLFWDCLTYTFIRTQRLQAGTITRTEQGPRSDAFTMGDEDQAMVAAMARTRLQYREPQPDYMVSNATAATAATAAGVTYSHHQPHHPQHHHHYPSHQQQVASQRNPAVFPIQVDTAENFCLGRCARAAGAGTADMIDLSHWWKSPAGVEEFVRERLTPEEYRAFVDDVLAGRDMGEEGESRIRFVMESLVPNAIYFPDGPRWNVMYLAMVVGPWVRGVKGTG